MSWVIASSFNPALFGKLVVGEAVVLEFPGSFSIVDTKTPMIRNRFTAASDTHILPFLVLIHRICCSLPCAVILN